MVDCTDDFTKQPLVINGFSELMVDIFGEDNGIGVHGTKNDSASWNTSGDRSYV